MMQKVRISDAVRGLLINAPKGPNLACPKASLCGAKSPGNAILWRDTLAHRRDRITLVSWNGMQLGSLASARTRAGYRVWEIDHLYMAGEPASPGANGQAPESPSNSVFLELLEDMVQEAGSRQGQRVVLRLPSDSPIFSIARRGGFFPYYEEILLEAAPEILGRNGSAGTPVGEARLPHDDYALFQLFCAATPQQVRVGLGLTFDQWKDALEPPRLGLQEWIIRHDDRVSGWLRLQSHQGVREGDIMVHPDHPENLEALVDLALSFQGHHRWLLPVYREAGTQLLLRQGFHEIARYTVLIKTLAAPVFSHGMAAVEA